jgi:hypothetical protein
LRSSRKHGRSLRLNDEAERRLSAVADQPLKDIIVVMRDTGMRNARELYCMRVENVDFDAGTIFTPDSKTESGRRFIPMSSRVKQILEVRCEGRSEGWVWMSRYKGRHIGEGMVYRQWARARQAAGLPRELVLYCARHDFGSFVLAKTGNLKAVMNAMGHDDVRSAMVYQHPEGEIIRNALNARHISRPTVPDTTRQMLEPNLDWSPNSLSRLLMPDQPTDKHVTSAFPGTDRGLLRSVLGPWSPVPKCEAPGAPISLEEHNSMAPRPRRQSQNPPLQNLPPFRHYRGLQNHV